MYIKAVKILNDHLARIDDFHNEEEDRKLMAKLDDEKLKMLEGSFYLNCKINNININSNKFIVNFYRIVYKIKKLPSFSFIIFMPSCNLT